MDYDIARSVTTVVMFLVFVGIAAWAYSARQRTRFDEAAQLPLEDELELLPAQGAQEQAK
jgi:cytochrome c oxidase cbb3-type subunit IV